MIDKRPGFGDDARTVGHSRLWVPALAAMLLFLLVAATFMTISILIHDAAGPSPAVPGEDVPEQREREAEGGPEAIP